MQKMKCWPVFKRDPFLGQILSSACVSIFLGQDDSFFLSVHEAKKLSHFDLKIWVKF